MRRRQGFTLVELLVAMALIIFIMSILSGAFVAATNTFRRLKASGDMAEKLRATSQLLQRDLAADHFEGKKRLSNPNFWLNGPPQQGFFQITQGGAGTLEGLDPSGIGSYYSTNHSLAFTVKKRGNEMGDFLSAGMQGGGSAPLVGAIAPNNTLANLLSFGPGESRYEATSGGSYNFQWAAVGWFLIPSINPTTNQQDTTAPDPTTGTPPVPLWTLYRRQALLVPDNSLVPTQPAASITQFQELSCWPNGGNLYFNSPSDITDPQRRMWGGAPAFTPIAQGQGTLSGSDIQLTDVLSFDVRLLVQGISQQMTANGSSDPFVTMFTTYPSPPSPPNVNVFSSPVNYLTGGPMVFDTWTSINDGLGSNYAQWNVPLAQQTPPAPGTTIPLWNGTSGPIIQAIQITVRIWDSKTNQSRQVTIVQAM